MCLVLGPGNGCFSAYLTEGNGAVGVGYGDAHEAHIAQDKGEVIGKAFQVVVARWFTFTLVLAVIA